MSPDRDPGRFEDDGRELDEYDNDSPRSIFSALWFRALLAVLVLGVLAAVAVPYVLDFAAKRAVKGGAAKPSAPAAPAATATPATPSPAANDTPPPVTARPKTEPPPAPAAKQATPKPAPPKPAASKPAVVAKAVEAPKAPAKAPVKAQEASKPAPSKAVGTPAGGPFWVQVGAFRDLDTAKQVAARLRAQGFRVDESPLTTKAAAPPAPSKAPADRYDVVVSGAPAADVDAKLTPKGLRGEATEGGIVVRPSLALREAVTLSRDLADAGLSVQVRRVGGPAASPVPAAAPPAGGQTLHRVRVGGFPDRATAVAAMKQLEAKGEKPFIAREAQ